MSRLILGAHSFLWTGRWTDAHLNLLNHARSLGLECLELALGDDVHFSTQPVRREAERLGMRLITGPGGLWPMDCDISHDDVAVCRRGLEWHKANIERTVELGAVAYTGAIYGHP